MVRFDNNHSLTLKNPKLTKKDVLKHFLAESSSETEIIQNVMNLLDPN